MTPEEMGEWERLVDAADFRGEPIYVTREEWQAVRDSTGVRRPVHGLQVEPTKVKEQRERWRA